MLKNLHNDARSLKLIMLFIPVVLALIITTYAVSVLLTTKQPQSIVYADLKPLSYFSLYLFAGICLLGFFHSNLYFTFIIFILLAFPAPVNDFFPGTYLGQPSEMGNAIFPFFTHIDIFLVFGILKAVAMNNKLRVQASGLFMVVIICMFVSLAVNFFDFKNNHEQLLLIQGLFQFRYLVELFVLLSLYDISKYKNHILISFVISVIFLFCESFIYTRKIHSEVLMSGSLANNVFASIVASILLFMLFVRKRYKHSLLFKSTMNAAFVIGIIIIIATGARMAVLAFFVTYFVIGFIENSKNRSLSKKLSWVITLAIFVYIVLTVSTYLPDRYNLYTIIDKVTINESSADLTKFIKIERSWETNSLITRLELYTTSLKMFMHNMFAGIGVGRWNIQKNIYGFREHLLIDSHNGYLSVISQYGLLGLPLMVFIYFFPTFKIYKNSKEKKSYNFLFYLAIINLFVSIADLSNSGIFKHQIFSLLAFNAICIMQSKNLAPQEDAGVLNETAEINTGS